MMKMNDLLWGAVFLALLLLPVVLLALDFFFFVRKKEKPVFEFAAFVVGGMYMLLAWAFWDLPDYTEPLNYYGFANVHEPVSSEHFLALLLISVVGFVCYFVLKYGRKKLPPLVEVFLLATVYIASALCMVWIVQLICGASPQPVPADAFHEKPIHISMATSDVFFAFCLCIVPFVFLVHAVHLVVRLVKEKADRQAELSYKNPVMQKINVWFLKGANLFWVAGIALLPVLAVLMLLLVLFGQQPNSAILAFTQTSDWILSQQISPPSVAQDAHYLCTVSLRGHRQLVKPIRYGIRRGEKIVVNRQLCVANAFEQLIMEKMPGFHKAVRTFYDTYGYPISKHIKSAWSADVTYIIMKPLEWIFLFVLYLFDAKPEDRINSQYLPGVEKIKSTQTP